MPERRCNPSVQDVARALCEAPDHGGWRAGMDDEDYREQARAVLALLPGRTEAEVKAEVLREAADWWDDPANIETLADLADLHYRPGGPSMTAIVMRHHADQIERGE